jgi:long-chain acyl-CoA synthetase
LAIHWQNSYEAALLYYAAFKAGIVAVPVDLRLKAPEIAYIFQDANPSLCFSAPELAPVARAAAASCSSIPVVREEIPFEPHAGNLPSVEEVQTVAILYTSGTTARPKGVELTHGAFVEICKSIKSEVVVSGGPGICMTPIMHIAALSQALGSISAGAGVVLLRGLDPGGLLDAARMYIDNGSAITAAVLTCGAIAQSAQPELASHRTCRRR